MYGEVVRQRAAYPLAPHNRILQEGDGVLLGQAPRISPAPARHQLSRMAGTSILGPTPPARTPRPPFALMSAIHMDARNKASPFFETGPPRPYARPKRGGRVSLSAPPLFFCARPFSKLDSLNGGENGGEDSRRKAATGAGLRALHHANGGENEGENGGEELDGGEPRPCSREGPVVGR